MHRIVLVLVLGSLLLSAQNSSTGSVRGIVTDNKGKPIAGALVAITRTFATPKDFTTPYSQSVKTTSDGSFLVQGLPPGTYAYCAQGGDGYVDGCQLGVAPPGLNVSAGQTVNATIQLATGSILKIRVLDPGKFASSVGSPGLPGSVPIMMVVWNAQGQFLPAHSVGSDSAGLNYQVTVPFDTALSFQIISPKLKLADSAGTALPGTASGPSVPNQSSQIAFQHKTGDANPTSFQFTITGVNP